MAERKVSRMVGTRLEGDARWNSKASSGWQLAVMAGVERQASCTSDSGEAKRCERLFGKFAMIDALKKRTKRRSYGR